MKHLALVMFGVAVFCSSLFAEGKKITVKGSDTMVILAQRWAERFMEKNKDVIVEVTGGGSGQGVAALINGTTDICNASRPMKSSEKDKLKERFGTRGIEIKCAMDGISFYVNESNPVYELSVQQIKDMFIGNLTNWNQVGGLDTTITLYGRENISGTYVFFKEHLLEDQPFASTLHTMPGTATIVSAVTNDVTGIGYGGVAYGRGIREIRIKADSVSIAYAPTLENIESGKYAASRFLYMYVRKGPSGVLKQYIDWILSNEGQEIVREVGYFPIH